MTTACHPEDRSARGYCPDDAADHTAERCSFGLEWVEASFCSGPSGQGDQQLEEATTTPPPPPPPAETLPAAGFDVAGVLLAAAALVAAGRAMITNRLESI